MAGSPEILCLPSAMSLSKSSFNAAPVDNSIPTVNFDFDDLRDRMARFTFKFDDFIERYRKRILDERNQFRVNIAELKEDQRIKKRDVEILSQKSNTHQQNMAKEAAETEEMKSTVATLTAQRDAYAANKETLLQRISETQKQIDGKLTAQRVQAEHIESQSRLNIPELEIWTTNLCMEIESAGQNDRLKFIFTHVDDQDWAREASFELDISKRDYEVPCCVPNIGAERIEKLVDRLNECRDLRVLLKGMRELFVEVLKH
ncbi:BgTH12-03593 [Blumeria graminis f. sp. triticale]|uniref:Kinetochore protein SPC25 n=1 Tax=Blumeria graminis f. sp. triticale TaxID=1689686 RepID=A0A9W4GBF5_BLUGR|nr:BgTH12-03593 [Blumeria graminis f. sp. triticale]